MSKGSKRSDARPKLAVKAEKMAIVSVRITTELKTALDRKSKRSGESESVIVREALEKYLKSA